MKEKIVIYQVLPRLFGNRNTTRKENGSIEENGCGKLNNFNDEVLARIHDMGFTHIWFTGVIRHATQTNYSSYGIPTQHAEVVKGKAGSPYAITDYYDIDPDLAVNVSLRMKEWETLIERTHKAGMKVIMDFVPNHVAREYHSICKPAGVRDLGEDDDTNMHFSTKNNFYYTWGDLDLNEVRYSKPEFKAYNAKDAKIYEPYEESPARATGNDRFDNRPGCNDWYETVKLNYGVDYCDAGGRSYHYEPVPSTWGKMTDILLYWASKGVDGFRCDMAEMVPTAFWSYATAILKSKFPHIIVIGEVYDPNQYRNYVKAGFDYLYDKVGMYDCLRGVIRGERPAASITHEWQVVDDIRDHMLYFLENHDEQRIASDFFCGSAMKAIPAAAMSLFFQKNPFMLYSGQEFGEKGMDKACYEAYDSCLHYAPDNVGALNNYAYYLSLDPAADLQKAEQMSLKAVQKEPDNATFLDTYAWILFKEKRYDDAKTIAERAIASDSTLSSVVVEHCGDIFYMAGDTDRAMEMWQKAAQEDEDNAILRRKIELKKYIEE